jgi:hypothetical protein
MFCSHGREAFDRKEEAMAGAGILKNIYATGAGVSSFERSILLSNTTQTLHPTERTRAAPKSPRPQNSLVALRTPSLSTHFKNEDTQTDPSALDRELDAVLVDKRYFKGGSPEDRNFLREQVKAKVVTTDSPSYAARLLLASLGAALQRQAKSGGAATGGNDYQRAAAALATLSGLKIDDHLEKLAGTPSHHDKSHQYDEVTDLAWRTAYNLASTAAGFLALMNWCGIKSTKARTIPAAPVLGIGKDGPPHVFKDVLPKEKEVMVFLRAADHIMARRDAEIDETGTAFTLQSGSDRNNLHGIWASPDVLCNVDLASLPNSFKKDCDVSLKAMNAIKHNRTGAPGEAEDEWAIGMVRNGIMKDGKNTIFAKSENRIKKMATTWVRRAVNARFLQLHTLFPFRHKSPFRVPEAVHGLKPERLIAMQSASTEIRPIVDTANALKDLYEAKNSANVVGRTQYKEAKERTPEMPFAYPDQDEINTALRLRVLEKVQTNTAVMRSTSGMSPVFGPDMEGIADKVTKEFSDCYHLTGDALVKLEQQVKQLASIANDRVTPESVEEWLNDVNTGDYPANDKETKIATIEDLIESTKTRKAEPFGLARALRSANGGNTDSDRKELYKNVKESMQKALKEMEVGSELTLHNGGNVGLSTKMLTASLSNLGTAFTGYLRGDLRLNRGRRSVYTMAIRSHAVEVFIGTSKLTSNGFGLGGGLGLSQPTWNAGIYGDLRTMFQKTKAKGVYLRFDRVDSRGSWGDNETKARMHALLETMFSDPHESGNEQGMLKRLLAKHPNLSVTFVDNVKEKKTTRHLSATLGGGLMPKKSPIRLRLSGTLATDATRKDRVQHESQGMLHVNQTTKGHSREHSASTQLSFSRAEALGSGVKLGVAAMEVGGIKATLYKSGYEEKTTIINKDGLIAQTSYRNKIYKNFNQFKAELEKEGVLEDLVEKMSGRYYPELYKKPLQVGDNAKRVLARAETHNQIRNFLTHARENLNPNNFFQEFHYLTTQAWQEVNNLRGLALLAERADDMHRARSLEAQVQHLLNADSSWERAFISCGEKGMTEKKTQLSAGLSYGNHNAMYYNCLYVV